MGRGRGGRGKLDPFLAEIERLLEGYPTLSGVRIREEIEQFGYAGGKTIRDDLPRELRPRFLAPRTFQRTGGRHRPAARGVPSQRLLSK